MKGWVGVHDNPNNYGRIPDAPEMECCGEFREDYCYGCMEYEDCKRESKEYERTDD